MSQELLETTLCLNSTKKRERMVSIEKLENLLGQDHIQKILCHNNGKDSLSWNVVFIKVHNAILKDLDNTNLKSKNVVEKQIQMMQNIILNISQKSVHHGNPLLECDTVICSILSIFESDFRIKFLGSTYTDLLTKYILTHRKFWGEIKLDQWNGLKNICKTCFIQPPPKVQSVIYLDTLFEIIRLSSKNVIISQDLLDMFPFIIDIISSQKYLCIAFAVSLLRLINILCLQLAVEFRYAVCSFMEEIFDFVLSVYEKKKNVKNPLIFHFLLIYLNTHNPNGVDEAHESFYASDECKWRHQIMIIFSITQEIVGTLSKNTNESDLEVGFLELFQEINYLAFSCGFSRILCSNLEQDVSAGYSENRTLSNKRKRLNDSSQGNDHINKFWNQSKFVKRDGNFCSIIQDLQSSNSWLWLTFLEQLLQKHPQILQTQLKLLVNALEKLLHDCHDVTKAGSICRCLCIILSQKKHFSTYNAENEEEMNGVWNKIALEIFRLFQIEETAECHRLLRSLITHSKFRNPQPLLNLYARGVVGSTNENLLTLLTMCQHFVFPESMAGLDMEDNSAHCNVRLFLLKLLFRENTRYSPIVLSKILITLIMTRSEEEVELRSSKNSETLVTSRNINDFCKFITNIYETIALNNLNFNEEAKVNETSFVPKIDVRMQTELISCLIIRHNEIHDELVADNVSTEKRESSIRDALNYCELICHLCTFLKNSDLAVKDWNEILVRMKSLVFLSTNKAYALLNHGFFCLTPFISLYSSYYHEDICKLIREKDSTYMLFLQHLFKTFQERRGEFLNDAKLKKEELKSANEIDLKLNSAFSKMINNPRSILHLKNLNEEERKMVESVEVLCQYIISPNSSDQNRFQKALQWKLLDELIGDESRELNSKCHLQIILRVIYNFSQFRGIDADTLNKILRLLILMVNSKGSDSEISMVILQIMKVLIESIRRTNDEMCKSDFFSTVKKFRQMINIRKKYGMSIVLKYVELLLEIVMIEWRGNSIFSAEGCEVNELCKEIIAFLKHPCYEVRLFTAQHIGKIFALPEKNDKSVIDTQSILINFLKNTLLDGSDIAEENSVAFLVSPYYKIMGISVSVISWASIICISGYWRKFALFHLINLARCGKCYTGKVTKALNVIARELRIKSCVKFISYHLSYLVQMWADSGSEIEEIPYQIFEFGTLTEFLENYSNLLLPVYLWSGKYDAANKIAEKQNRSIKEIVKNSFPELMALVLPHLNENIHSDTVRKANNIRDFVEKELGSLSSDLLTNDLDKIIFRMFYFMEDKNYLHNLMPKQDNIFEECRLIHFKVLQIEEGLENMTRKKGQSLLGALALHRPFIIQKVLILLCNEVERAPISDDKVLSLHKYIAFIDILSKTTRTSQFRSIIIFVVREVIHTLMSFIQSWKDKRIIEITLKCLDILLRNYIHEFSSAIGDFLSVLAVLCKPLVQDGNEKALDILKFLICENSSKLISGTAKLDPFPNEKVFDEINCELNKNKCHWTSVEEAITHFLDISSKKKCSVEGLKYLRSVLTACKDQLNTMCGELKKLKGFSEDCSKSLLHRTICVLIELTTVDNSAVKVEAARCLGELGPLDLATLVLKPENRYAGEQIYMSSLFRLLKICIKVLSDLVIHKSFEIKMAASELLYTVLATQPAKEILKEEDSKIRSYLLPFSLATEKALTVKLNGDANNNNLCSSTLWIPGNNHEEWVRNLVAELMKSITDNCDLMQGMAKMAEISGNFAERMFPAILDLIFSFNQAKEIDIINKNIRKFFEECFSRSKKTELVLNPKSVQCMVNVVDYIRIQRNFEGNYELDLKLNYLHVAEAARCCSAFFTSILYLELWANEKKKSKDTLTIDEIWELYPDEGFTLTTILRDCYSKIGILDGVHGCGYTHLLDFSTESQHYEYLNKWNISMLYHDVELSQGTSTSELRLMNSLHQFGMFYSVDRLIQESNNKEDLCNIQFKCASILANWNLVDTASEKVMSIDSFERNHYFALKAFHDDDQSAFQNEIYRARKCTINKLSSCSLESVENLYHLLSELRCLKELEDFESIRSSGIEELKSLRKRWHEQDRIPYSDFRLIENILTQRVIIVKEESQRNTNPYIKAVLHEMLCEMYYKLLKSARKQKRYEIAIRNLSCLSRLDNLPNSILGKMKIEKSLLEWEIGDKNVGKFLLRHYLQREEIKGELRAKALRIYGDWMASTNSENSRNIIEHYYHKSIQISKSGQDRSNSYASLAKFADSNYEQMKEYLTSPLFEMKKNLINRQQDLASELRQEIGWSDDRDKKIACRLVERQSIIDEKEIKNSECEMDFFLGLAVRYFLLSLIEGDKYDFLVFRLISLWFSNFHRETVLTELKKYLPDIPTHKFLCLLPQILPRMNEIGMISNLIERILQDHPYHTLPVLFAVANSFEDAKYGEAKPITHSQRSLVARAMLEKFHKDHKLEKMITEMDRFCDAAIELANINPREKKTAKAGIIVDIPPELKISSLRNLEFVSVPSVTIPPRKHCNYENVPGIKCFEARYQLVGGINVPKKIKCTGLDGVTRSLLIKGRDDLRQDAVMQQVFSVINLLLHNNPETNRRKLVIRTYKVVPLSHRSGIIEWCENTQPLSLYLIGPDGGSGAHKRFNHGDLTALECRSRMRKVFNVDATNDLKLKVFLDICEKFRPAFRHFFFENFPDPGVWFERRLAYIRSVATSSMIGYILGIGDRHVHNILIDNSTAEVIHIDLGIAFEQGKTLPTPETVPFRLTRDIVDGMGMSGIEGVFRLSCIKTMEVLRENHHTILTLLEVLLYDPLYAWTITAEKAFSVQGHAGTDSSTEKNSNQIEINKMAERALIRLKQKLQGIETGGVATNAEGQVNYLIQQARDPNNLCRLFHGWQPYL